MKKVVSLMEQLLLVRPAARYEKDIAAYKEEFVQNGDSMDGTAGLSGASSIPEWFCQIARNTCEETVQPGFVPSSTFLAVHAETGKLLGMIDIRHCLNDHLLHTGGHIGYSVRKSERQKGYAKEMLRQALQICRDQLNLSRCLLTCSSDNIASIRTIEANGGRLENIVEENGRLCKRYWITLSTPD